MPRYPTRKRKPSYYSCGKMVYGDAAKALKLAKHLKTLVNVEIKNHDVQQTTVQVGSAPVIVQLTNILQGDTTGTRDGAQCKVIALEFTMQVTLNSSAARTAFRCLIICDRQTNKQIYIAQDVLADVSSPDMIYSPKNLNNNKRFQILADFVTKVDDSSGKIKQFKRKIKLNKMIRYDGTGSSPPIVDITQNSLSLLMVSSEGVNGCLITTFSRIRFVDN